MREYAVVRTWQTKHQRRQIVVGPYATRWAAQRQINEYVNEYGYWNDRAEFTIALYRRPEAVTELGEVV